MYRFPRNQSLINLTGSRLVLALLSATALSGSFVVKAHARSQAIQLDPVIVTTQDIVSGGISGETKDADVVVSAASLDLSGPSDLQDVFSQETSASVGGSIPTSQKLYVHGIEENNLNVQIDGARQVNNIWHHNGGTLVDPSLLKGVQLNAGVAPADAGPHALGGAVRYETKDVDDLLEAGRNLGAYIYGAYDTNSQTFTRSGAVYGKASGFEVLAFGSMADGDNYSDGSGRTISGTAADLTSGLGKFAYETSGGDRFELSTDYVTDEGIRPFRANFAAFTWPSPLNWPDTYQEYSRHTTNFSYKTRKPGKNYDPEINVYHNLTELSRNGQFRAEVESIGGKAQNTFTTRTGKITAGVDYYNDKAKNRPAAGGSFSEEASNFGIYSQARLGLIEGLRISFGARGDFHQFDAADGQKFDNFGFSPNAGFEFDITRRFTLMASAARTFGGIKLSEVGGLSGAGTYNPDIKPEWSTSYKIGGKYKNNGWTVESWYFNTTIDDTVNPYITAGGRSNIGELESRGIDFATRYNWSNAYLGFKYSHIDVTLNGKPVTTLDFFVGTPVGDVFTLSGAYSWKDIGVTVGFSSEFVTDFDELVGTAGGPPPAGAKFGKLDGYLVVNTFAEWNPKGYDQWTLRAEVNNIFDEQYADRATSAGLSAVDPLYEPGRSVKISGKVKF